MDYVRVLCSTAIALGLFCFVFPNERLLEPIMAVLFIATLAALGAYIWSQRCLYGEFRFTPNVVTSAALFLWHLGFVGIYITGLATDFRILDYFETSPHSNVEGIAMVAIGIAAFILGLTYGEARCTFPPEVTDRTAATISTIVLGIGTLLVCAYFAIKGRHLMGEYNSVFTEADSQRRAYNFGLMLAITGLAPAVLFAETRMIVLVTVAAALTVAVVAALMGTRWVFLVMLALVVSALQFRGQRISIVLVAVVGIACVTASIVVKEGRAGNPINSKTIGDYFGGRYTNPAVEFFEETGQALISCIYSAGEFRSAKRLERGKTFWHALRSVLPGAGAELRAASPMFVAAQNLFPVRFVTEGFTTGYSIFAEWFVNFGIAGVVFGSALMGYGLGLIWRFACERGDYLWTALSYCWAGYLTFGFRNDAMTWMRFVTWSAAIIVLITWLMREAKGHDTRPITEDS